MNNILLKKSFIFEFFIFETRFIFEFFIVGICFIFETFIFEKVSFLNFSLLKNLRFSYYVRSIALLFSSQFLIRILLFFYYHPSIFFLLSNCPRPVPRLVPRRVPPRVPPRPVPHTGVADVYSCRPNRP